VGVSLPFPMVEIAKHFSAIFAIFDIVKILLKVDGESGENGEKFSLFLPVIKIF
jgi:hypothetical protein